MTLLLLVDDQALILHVVADALEDGGFATVQALNGDEAIRALNDPACNFSGVVTDIDIGPGASGWDVARAARHINPDMPVVYMTGASAGDWPAEGVPNSRLVQKPFAVAQITTAIAQLINDTVTRSAMAGDAVPRSATPSDAAPRSATSH